MFTRSKYRWTEMYLLLLPASFLLLGWIELLLVRLRPDIVSQKTLPPLEALLPALGLIAALGGAHFLLCIIAPEADQTLLPIAGTLASIGVLMSIRLGPDLGQDNLGTKQLGWVIIGLACCVATVWATRNLQWLRLFKYTWAILGLALVGITFIHARSLSLDSPSRDVLGLGPFSLQPSELLKICLVIFFAGYLSEHREMLTAGGPRIGRVSLPPIRQLGPLIAMLGISLLIFVGLRELGLAMLIFGLFVAMLYVASNRADYVVGSLAIFAIGAVIIYQLASYVRDRVAIVSTAFDPKVEPFKGYQIVQGLIAFGVGGVFGQGLGLGHPTFVPAVNTDYVAAAFGEEFGLAGLLALIGLFALLIYRGMRVAVIAREPFDQLLACGLTAIFALQTLVILAGNLKVMPLTGIPLPFVAYGGSSVIANFIIIGLLLRLSKFDA
ncbi:MAG TPA: FtsW/RodA/SpoVE family cell cycle protein [Ktedonobacterales bacterium]|nr:FtsW/RodA/SpoVE family cell cycle protein [Ktedonobacterales bacterium]